MCTDEMYIFMFAFSLVIDDDDGNRWLEAMKIG